MGGVERIAAERLRQKEQERWTEGHDKQHFAGELAMAAICYAAPEPIRMKMEVPINCGCREAMCPHSMDSKKVWRDPWPWEEKWDKRKKHDRLKQLVIAGALIAAEIDRLERVRGERAS
jgi:hypothetical protein